MAASSSGDSTPMAVRQKMALTLFALLAIFMHSATALAQNPAPPTPATPLAAPAEQPAPANTAAPASAQPSEGFTMVPAYPNSINPHGFIFELKPGGKTEEYAGIKNFSNETVHFSLYGADPAVSNTGSPAYLTREQATKDGPGSWIHFAEPEIDLKPGEERVVKFSVEIPSGTAPGDYRVGIAMEKSKKDAANASITIATRFIIQSSVKVTNDPKPVPRQDGREPPQSSESSGPTWQTYYFWVSLGLFLASLALLIWATLSGKRAGRRHGTTRRQRGHSAPRGHGATRAPGTKHGRTAMRKHGASRSRKR